MVTVLFTLSWIFCGIALLSVFISSFIMIKHIFSLHCESRRKIPWYQKEWVWFAICFTSLMLFSALYSLANQLLY